MIAIPDISDKRRLNDWLVKNKSLLMTQKKSVMKFADSVSSFFFFVDEKDLAEKAGEAVVPADATKIKVRSIVNTTKLFDSHGDVHIDQLWNKSLKETKNHFLVKEHNFSFDGIIS